MSGMTVQVYGRGVPLKKTDPDEYIFMKELDNVELKSNHLKLYIKTIIVEKYDVNIEHMNSAIDRIDFSIFINGICGGNKSIRSLLAKNVIYELKRNNIDIDFDTIYNILTIG